VIRIAVLVALAASTSIAHADPASTREAMEDYFAGEKRGGLILAGMGAVGLAGATVLYLDEGARARGASYVLGGIGLAHAAAGAFVWIASNRRIDKFTAEIAADEAAFVATESRRMKGVSRQFTILEIVEVIGIAGGITLAVVGNQTDRPRLEGAGYALAGEMAATLVFDIFAARRAGRYRTQLVPTVDPTTRTSLLSIVGSF
jgi:hypothetical protein